jgi:hypothetical protein
LHKEFHRASGCTLSTLKKKLLTLEMAPTETVRAGIDRANMLRREIERQGEKVADFDMKLALQEAFSKRHSTVEPSEAAMR